MKRICANHVGAAAIAVAIAAGVFVAALPFVSGASELENMPPSEWMVRPREVAEDEIKGTRGPIEDQLRRRLLSLLHEEAVLAPVREVLNRPWDEEGVRYLCNMAFSYERSARPRPTFEGSQRDAALDLLAYVHTAYKDDVGANKATQLIRRNFDALFGSIASKSDNWPLFFRAAMYGIAVNAIEEYGSAALLTAGFWECFETFQQGFAGLRAVRAVGDKEALARLERLEKTLRA